MTAMVSGGGLDNMGECSNHNVAHVKLLGRKTEMSGMERRKGPPKMTQGVD